MPQMRTFHDKYPKLLYIKNKPLQILALRMVDIDWMVGRLGELVEDAHLTTRNSGCGKDGGAEQLLRYRLRAGESKEDTATLYLRQCSGIESLIALHSISEHLMVLGKSRWVKDYHIILIANIL